MDTHLFFSTPAKSCRQAIENTTKKNIKMRSVSLSRGIAAKSAVIRTLSPLILVIVLSGRMTLKALRLEISEPELCSYLGPTSCWTTSALSDDGRYWGTADTTMTKSRMFQLSRR